MPDGPFPPAASLDLGSPPSSVLLAATTPSTPSRWTPVSLVPRYQSGHRFASLPARADGFWSPGLELIYPGSPSRPCRWEDAGSPKFPSHPCRDMPRSRTPVVSRPAPPPAGRDAAFRARKHVGSSTTNTRFRGSIPRPISSLLLAPHGGLLRRAQDSLPVCRRALAGWDYRLLYRAGHPLGNAGEFHVVRQSPRLGLRLAQSLRGQAPTGVAALVGAD
jgi:hypothetical protein